MPCLPLTHLNHISLVCRSAKRSLDFYQNFLGFVPIKRPESFDFLGAWLQTKSWAGIPYVRRKVKVEEEEEGGIRFSVDRLFFHDPDGFMIEICNCDNLPRLPLLAQPVASRSLTRRNTTRIS